MSARISPSPLSRSMAASFNQFPTTLIVPRTSLCSNPNLKFISFSGKRGSQTLSVRCNSSIFPGGPGSSGTNTTTISFHFFKVVFILRLLLLLYNCLFANQNKGECGIM